MIDAQIFTPQVIFLTEAAQNRLRQLQAHENNLGLILRLRIGGGGCAGFQYGFELVEHFDESDKLIEINQLKVVIDPLSLPYVIGATIDYEESLMGQRFLLHNPNAERTCSCGVSFSPCR